MQIFINFPIITLITLPNRKNYPSSNSFNYTSYKNFCICQHRKNKNYHRATISKKNISVYNCRLKRFCLGFAHNFQIEQKILSFFSSSVIVIYARLLIAMFCVDLRAFFRVCIYENYNDSLGRGLRQRGRDRIFNRFNGILFEFFCVTSLLMKFL